MDGKTAHSGRAGGVLAFPKSMRETPEDNDVATDKSRLLDVVMNNMSQGILLFDEAARLAFCNRRYLEIYGLTAEMAKPGCTLHDLLNHRIAARTFSGNPDEYVEELLGDLANGKISSKTTTLGDGRVISIVSKPIAGGGWIATHEDTTERQRVERRIAHMARHDALTDLQTVYYCASDLGTNSSVSKEMKISPCSASTSTISRA